MLAGYAARYYVSGISTQRLYFKSSIAICQSLEGIWVCHASLYGANAEQLHAAEWASAREIRIAATVSKRIHL